MKASLLILFVALTFTAINPSKLLSNLKPSHDDIAIMVKRIDQEPQVIIKYVWAGTHKAESFC